MSREIYIGSAWPYVNGPLHLGHVAALLPADVIARYHRLVGDRVLWTSGSDCHGTPITERARKEGRTPREVAKEFHDVISHTFDRLGFSYSLYWATMESEHISYVQESFRMLYDLGLIIEDDYQHAYCALCQDTRTDREITGRCPHCGNDARGDQCDTCGEVLNPSELKNPVCSKCAGAITFEITRELFFDLPAVETRLREWVTTQTHWRDNAKSWTQGWLDQGLKPRAITRKINWGIPVPLPGWEDRRIYVWFEAVHGYWTASRQWAVAQNSNSESWRPFWDADNPNLLTYYVIGKDNIPFHTLMWPAILIAERRALPWQIVASEYLVFEDRKLSTSKGWVLWADDALDRYDPDFLRYFLIAHGPEHRDTNFTWDRFALSVNGELIDNYGNLVQRVLSFASKRFDGKVPLAFELDERDEQMLNRADNTFAQVGSAIERTEFKQALEMIMALVRSANQYLNDAAPWTQIKTDAVRAGTTVAVALNVIMALSILTEPFLPFQAKRVRSMLPMADEDFRWAMPLLKTGVPFGDVQTLFTKIEPSIIEEEHRRLEAQLKGL
ncbi:methionine--tRNA ligase [Candidatus Uhrbacteria bacterium]|nr:methionine--tRNA ligase [Candidatus Uhrbacteria bacterium]